MMASLITGDRIADIRINYELLSNIANLLWQIMNVLRQIDVSVSTCFESATTDNQI